MNTARFTPSPPSVEVLGYEVARVTLEDAAQWCLQLCGRAPEAQAAEPKLLVTLNPEIIVQARADARLRAALRAAELTVADGVGILWAARRAAHPLPERVPGVDLVARLLELGGSDMRVFFLGAKPGVAERAAAEASATYGTQTAGVQHGYFERPGELPSVLEKIRTSGAQLLLAGLGEGQELFLHEHRAALGVPLMIGVGGTLDVLAGEVKRTPAWTRRVGLEWAYRVGFSPARWHRIPRLLRFVGLVLRGG